MYIHIYACPFYGWNGCVIHPFPYLQTNYVHVLVNFYPIIQVGSSLIEARSDVTYDSHESKMLPTNTKEKKRPHP